MTEEETSLSASPTFELDQKVMSDEEEEEETKATELIEKMKKTTTKQKKTTTKKKQKRKRKEVKETGEDVEERKELEPPIKKKKTNKKELNKQKKETKKQKKETKKEKDQANKQKEQMVDSDEEGKKQQKETPAKKKREKKGKKKKTPAKSMMKKKKKKQKMREEERMEDDDDEEAEDLEIEDEEIDMENYENKYEIQRTKIVKHTAITIETTLMQSEDDIERIKKIVKKLHKEKAVEGDIKLGQEEFQGHQFTHLITGKPEKRSIKYMFAVAYGAEILNTGYIKELEKAAEEKPFKLPDPKPYRIKSYASTIEKIKEKEKEEDEQEETEENEETEETEEEKKLLTGIHLKFSGSWGGENAKKDQHLMKKMANALGASTPSTYRHVDICVLGPKVKKPEAACFQATKVVNYNWLMDSLQQYQPLDVEPYLVKA